MRKIAVLRLFPVIFASMWANPSAAQPVEPAHKEAGDVTAITRMHDYFLRAPEIEFTTSFTETSDLPGMGRNGTAHFSIRRPNSFRVELKTNKGDYVFVSDGKTFTLYRPDASTFARVAANDSIIGTMYLAIGLLGTQAKLIDFIWTLDYGEQMRTEAGGSDTIAGEACNRFSVQRFESTWDVWLSDSDPPLLCKLVSHRTDANDRRVQSNEFTWVRTPEFAPGTFSFVPPAGAREVGPSDLK